MLHSLLNRVWRPCLAAACLVALAGSALADGDSSLAIVNRYVRQHTVAGARVDLDRIKLPALGRRVAELEVLQDAELQQVRQALGFAGAGLGGLVAAGADELWVLVDAEHMNEPVTVILTIDPDKVADDAAQTLMESIELLVPAEAYGDMKMEAREDHLLLAFPWAQGEIQASNHKIADYIAADRTQAATAFLCPSADHLRAARETLGPLPPPFQNVDVPTLTRNVKLAAVDLMLAPEIGFEVTCLTDSETAASSVSEALNAASQDLLEHPELMREAPEVASLLGSVKWETDGNRSYYRLTEGGLEVKELTQALARRMQQARGSAARMQDMNNQKQLMLALHNYYDTHREFPSNIQDEEGNDILSWRVRLLPYMEQQALYNAIKLDEPWDSEHNQKFHELVIPVLRSPLAPDLAPGKTIYVHPIAEGTIFGPEGAKEFRDVLDGTSNTIVLLSTAPGAAVNWMEPADLSIDFDDPFTDLLFFDENLTNVGFLDGSVQTISRAIDKQVFQYLLQFNDGNPVRR